VGTPRQDSTVLAGKYRLLQRIGTGGMGSVWRAEHMLLQRAVAVKLIELRGGDPMLADRFLREARVAASVRHPNVVDIIDFGRTDSGQPFMVMELLDGESLLHRMIDDRPPLSTQQILHVVVQLLMGLDAVHRAGIIHRDLKPGNIFLSYDDDGSVFARLLDFGISYSIQADSKLRRGQFGTDERLVTGTPEYMSPEQAEGRPDVDVRGDVYAVGVILYELLTNGELPYADPNPGGVLFKVMTGVHRPLVELRPDLPELCQVVESAIAHDRDKRPASARELRRQLLSALGLGPETSGMHFRIERTSQTDILRATPRSRDTSESPTLDRLAMPLPSTSTRTPRRGQVAAAALGVAVAAGVGLYAASRPSSIPPAPAAPAAVVAAPAPAPVPSTPAPIVEEAAPPVAEVVPEPPAEPVTGVRPVPGATVSSAPAEPSPARRARREAEAAAAAAAAEAAAEAPAEAPAEEPAETPTGSHVIVRDLDF
jgi:serine/threonine-protein kinase